MRVLRAVKKRKKVRKLGAIDSIRREAYADLGRSSLPWWTRSAYQSVSWLYVALQLRDYSAMLARSLRARRCMSVGVVVSVNVPSPSVASCRRQVFRTIVLRLVRRVW